MVYYRVKSSIFHSLFNTGIIDKHEHPILCAIDIEKGKVYFVNETSLKGPKSLRAEFYVHSLKNGYGIVCNGHSKNFNIEHYKKLKEQFEYEFEIITDPEIINVLKNKSIYKEKDSFLVSMIPINKNVEYRNFINFHYNSQVATENIILLHESKLKYLFFTHDANYTQIKKATELILMELNVIINKNLLEEDCIEHLKRLRTHFQTQKKIIEEPIIKELLQKAPGNVIYDHRIADYENKINIFCKSNNYFEYFNDICKMDFDYQRNIITELAAQATMSKHVNINEVENRFKQNSVTNLFRVPGEIGGVPMDWDFQEELRKQHGRMKKKSPVSDLD